MPPLLLGATLLFWGWQAGAPVVGAVAAAVVEGRHVVRWRWDLTRADFNRISDVSALVLVALAAYQAATNEPARAVTAIVEWVPLVLLPLVAGQLYSGASTVDASVFFWSLRRQAAAAPGPGPRPIDLAYPYFVLTLVAASAANVPGLSYYAGVCVLAAWALWGVRAADRYRAAAWWGALVAVVLLGHAGHLALFEMQRALERAVSSWLFQLVRADLDPDRSTTGLGQIGALKLSNRIVMRVAMPPAALPPVLLREAAYDAWVAPAWVATRSRFGPVGPEADGATWTLARPAAPPRHLTVSAYLRRGRGMLALPAGAHRLEGLAVVYVSRNRFGAVRVEEGLGLVTYGVRFGPHEDDAGRPTDADLVVPASDAPVIGRIAADLRLASRPPDEAVHAVHAYFLGRFRYSRFLGGRTPRATPLEDFLDRTRAGHCEYFATATVLLLRAAGIPARYAVGWAVYEWSGLEGRYVVRARDAHSWALAWIDGAWRDVDTTPAAWVPSEQGAASFWEPLADVWSWGVFLVSRWRWSEPRDRVATGVGWLLVPLLALLAWRLYRRQRVARGPRPAALAPGLRSGRGEDSEFYLVERRLVALGFARAPAEPLSAWLRAVEAARPASVRTEALGPLLALHYRYRFDPQGLPPAQRQALRSGARAWLAEQQPS